MFFKKKKESEKDSKNSKQINVEVRLNYLGRKYIKIKKEEVIVRGNDCYCSSYDFLKWIIAKYRDSYCLFTDYREDKDYIYLITDGYFGLLCDTLEELRNLTVKEIEGKAYNIYMTSAR